MFNRVMKEPRRTRGWLLGSCLVAGGAGLFALACGTEQQATSPEFPGVTLSAGISSSSVGSRARDVNAGPRPVRTCP